MPKEVELTQAIVGDIVAAMDVTINTKGGSMTATLRKALRDKLGELGDHLSAAALQFATGQAILLLRAGTGSATSSPPVRVRRLGKNRFEIELETGDDEDIDEVTVAFLRLKEDQFKKGILALSEAATADEWRAEMDRKLDIAKAAMERTTETTKTD